MDWYFSPYTIALMFAAALTGAMAYIAGQQRGIPAKLPLALLMLAITQWSLGAAIEAAAPTIPLKILWSKITYFGTVSAPVCYLLFVLAYTHREKWLTRNLLILIWLIPVATLFIAWSNEAHLLLWNSFTRAPGGRNILIYGHGPWFWVFVAYDYVLMLIGALLLANAMARFKKLYRQQAATMLIGSAFPWLGNILYVFDLDPIPGLDLTPFAFALTGLTLSWALIRFRLFELTPVAREAIVENMADGVIVLDTENRVVDINPAAELLLGFTTNSVIGRPGGEVFAPWPELVARFRDVLETQVEICLDEKTESGAIHSGPRFIDLRISALLDRRRNYAGRLLVLRDVTERKYAEQALRAQQESAHQFSKQLSTLHQVSMELSLAKSVDELCQLAVEVGRSRLGFDRMGIWLVDPADSACMLGTFGTDEQGRLRDERSLRLPILEGTIWYEIIVGKTPSRYEAEAVLMDDRYGTIGRGERAAAALWDGKEVIGQMSVDNFLNRQHITDHQRELLVLYARLVGHLVTLKRTEQAEHEQRVLAEALRDTAALLSGTLHLEEVFERILANVDRVVPYDAVNLMMIEGDTARIIHSHGYVERGLREYVDTARFKWNEVANMRRMVESGQTCVVADTQAWPEWVIWPETAWFRSYAGAPILIKNQVVGFLNLDSATPGFYTQARAERLQAFADQAAAAIANARLFAETSQRAEQLAILNRIGLAITSGLDMDHVLQTLMKQCMQVAPVECFYVARYDRETGLIHMPLFYDMDGYKTAPPRSITERPGLTGYVINTRRTLYLPDTLDPTTPPPVPIIRSGGTPSRAYVGVPLILRDQVVGVMSMQSYQPAAYTPDHIRLFETIATQAVVAIENARLYAEVQQLAIVDELTNVYNYRGLSLLGPREVERAQRFKRPLSALFFDIDHFRDFNNRYSHAVGNVVLRAVAECTRAHMRSVDLVARYGGEEFVVLLPETGMLAAQQIAERLRRAVEVNWVPTQFGPLRVTISIGVAELTGDMEDMAALIDAADRVEHIAKDSGRNCVACL